MERRQQTFDDLIEQYHNYLLSINRCADNIRHYRYEWERIKRFMSLHQIEFYNRTVGNRYLSSVLGEFEYTKLPRLSKKLVNMVDSFAKFQETGVLKRTGPRIATKNREKYIPPSLTRNWQCDYQLLETWPSCFRRKLFISTG